MKKLVITKPQRSLGDKIGPVKIIERGILDCDSGEPARKTAFLIEQISTGKFLGWRWELENVIAYCHQNLIPIQSIERLKPKAKQL